jgi:2-hydroxy-3-keto-5-methylthiopentenyl-1-phosphate phosphatase
MWSGVSGTLNYSLQLLEQENVHIDPYFKEFHDYVQNQLKIQITVVSAGLEPLVNLYMDPFLVEMGGCCKVYANGVKFGDHWEIIYRDESSYGHDKGKYIREAKENVEYKE